MSFGKTISLYYATFLVLWLGGAVRLTESLQVIIRGHHDKFQNTECLETYSTTGTDGSACSDFSQYCDNKKGVCDDNSDCSYCICKVQNRNTFVGQGSGSGKCVKDEQIEPKSVPVDSFELRSNRRDLCATQENDASVSGNDCNYLTHGMLWIWTTWKQFMNIETLQCIEVPVWKNNQIAMKPCSISYQNQEFSCSENTQKIYLTKRLNNNIRYFRMKGRDNNFVIDVNRNERIWSNYDDSSTLLCRKTEYKGCYRFSDGSFLHFLNLSACQEDEDCLTQKISAPIYKHNTICEINWADSKYKQNEDSWTPVHDKTQFLSLVDGESSNTRGIQLNISDHDVLEKWNGLLLKLQINCSGRNWPSEQHCVLLKFASLPEPQVTKSTTLVPPVTTQKPSILSTTLVPHVTTQKPSILSSITINPTSSEQSYFTDAKTSTSSSTIFPGSKSEMDGGSSSSIAAAISVSIVALVLILSLLGFMFYRRRKRMQERANSEEMISQGEQNPQKDIYEEPSKMYEEVNDEQGETIGEHYYEGLKVTNPPENPPLSTASDVYDYIDGDHGSTKPGSTEEEYSYAKSDAMPTRSLGTSAPPATTPVYQTLEGTETEGNPSSSQNGIPKKAPSVDNNPPDQQPPNPVYQTLEEPNAQKSDPKVEYITIAEPDAGQNASEPLGKSSADTSADEPVYHELDKA